MSFRGPKRDLESPFIAICGGSETFASAITAPYASVMQSALHRSCINFGTRDGGLEALLRDPPLTTIVNGAYAVVIECGQFEGLSNRYYMVHPRQNSRLLYISPRLLSIWPQIRETSEDFVTDLIDIMPNVVRAAVLQELSIAWEARLRMVLRTAKIPTTILSLDARISSSMASLQDDFPQHKLLDFSTLGATLNEGSHAALGAALARELAQIGKSPLPKEAG